MQVYEFVKLRNVYYAGSHGMDISTPSGSSKCEDQRHQIKGVDEKVFTYMSVFSLYNSRVVPTVWTKPHHS